MSTARSHDVIVYGATGFVGKLTAAYLAREAPEANVALAGRSRAKLDAVKAELGPGAADWPVLVVDAADADGLAELAGSATVVATTVGPYRQHGMPIAAACAAAGTHYADLTGEVGFVRDVIDSLDAAAKATGARIVTSCGFDSIPSDLGVYALADGARRDNAGDLEDTRLVVTAIRGGVSGGTIASLKGQTDDLRQDATLRRLVADPYGLSPDRDKEPELGRESDIRAVSRDPDTGRWLAPFVMAAYNTRIVRRSNALQDWGYGRSFRYNEYVGFPANPLGLIGAVGMTGGLAALSGGLGWAPTRALLDRVLPGPGEGPSEKVQRSGHFAMEIRARTSTGDTYLATVTGKRDPGYAGTAVMLGESALALAQDGDALPPRAGVLTPATGVGRPLIDRLRRHGFSFDVNSVPA